MHSPLTRPCRQYFPFVPEGLKGALGFPGLTHAFRGLRRIQLEAAQSGPLLCQILYLVVRRDGIDICTARHSLIAVQDISAS